MKRFSIFLLFLFIFLLFVHDIQSFDLWWHLKTGQYIIQNFKIPHTDLYSYTSVGKPWMDMQWLFQAILFLVYKYSGCSGLILFNALVVLSIFLIIFKAVYGPGEYFFTAAAVFLAALCLWERGSLRPEVFSYFYLSIFVYVLHRYKYAGSGYNKNYIYLLPLVQLFWVNSHALFILGIVLVYSYVLGETLSSRVKLPVLNDKACRIEGEDYRRLLVAAALITVVSFLNPYTYRAFIFPFTLLDRINGSIKIFSAVGELPVGEIQPPFSSFCPNTTILFYKSILALSFAAMLINSRRLSWPHLISYSFFFGLSFLARRNIPPFALVCVPIITENLCQAVRGRVKEFLARGDIRFAGSCIIAVITALGIIDLSGGGERIRGNTEKSFYLGMAPFKYPDAAVSFVEKASLKGNIFNDLQSGNYLIWRFYPERKVFLDGRLEVHSEEFYTEYVRLLEDPGLWPKIVKKYNINYVLLSHVEEGLDKLLTYLYSDSGWKLVYFDDVAVVFVKDSEENKKIIKNYRIDVASSDFSDIGSLGGLSPKLLSRIYSRRGNFFARFAVFEKAKQNYTKALIYDSFDENIYINLGIIHSRENDFLSAGDSYKNALKINPHSVLASLNLGALYYRRNNIGLAVKCYRDAIKFGGGLNGAYYDMAGICLLYGQYEQAEKWYLKLLNVRPWNINARVNLGVVYARQGLYEKAEKEFSEVLKTNPDDPIVLKNIARLSAVPRR
jgi:tetratricopeptide (TPR) repeat protein